MSSFGHKLRTEREKRAITLEQISTSTKIGTRMLQALEKEDFDQLPGGIFNKGFVRAYARYVGLDEDQTVSDYLEASGQNVAPNPDPADVSREAEEDGEPAPPWRTALGWAAAGLLIVALALTLWNRRQHNHNKGPHPEPVPPAAASTPKSNANANININVNSSSALSPSGSSLPPAVSAVSASGAAPVPKAATISLSAALPAPAPGEFTVLILAQEESWVSFQVDDSPPLEDTLIAGTQRALHARKQVLIKAGNTGALDFVFNGKKLPSQGDYGEVKTLIFGVTGLQARASAPPTTP